MTRLVLGIDAGGTKTIGLLADEMGRTIASARAGAANLSAHGEREVEKAFAALLAQLAGHGAPAAACVGMAGVDRAREQELVSGILRRLGHRGPVTVVNDAAIALVAGARERFGIVLISGTGSIAYGLDRQGRSARAGGYGYLMADEGSGFWLGQQVLRATVRDLDGRGPKTTLRDRLFGTLGIDSMDELVPLVYERNMPRNEIARLAVLVEEEQRKGDAVAGGILEAAAHELSAAARAVALRLAFGEPFAVVLAGGVFKACPTLHPLVERALQIPKAKTTLLDVEPAEGAVLLALDLLRAAFP
jgi:N-acetylglucosamine kinase-like BadF-type ATPase